MSRCRNTDLTLATGVLADQPPPDWELEPEASSSGTVHSSRCGSTHTHTYTARARSINSGDSLTATHRPEGRGRVGHGEKRAVWREFGGFYFILFFRKNVCVCVGGGGVVFFVIMIPCFSNYLPKEIILINSDLLKTY